MYNIKLFILSILMFLFNSCKGYNQNSIKIIDQQIILSDDFIDTIFVNKIDVISDKVIEKKAEVIYSRGQFKTKEKIGVIYDNLTVISVFQSNNTLSLLCLSTGGGLTICTFVKGLFAECGINFNKWFITNSNCIAEMGLSLKDSDGIQEVVWQGAFVLKVKQIKQKQPERIFALIGPEYKLLFEGDEIKKQKVFDFSFNSNTFSKFLNQRPWIGVSMGGTIGSFNIPAIKIK